MAGETRHINLSENNEEEQYNLILTEIYGALCEKGYDPISQIVGWLKTDDPTYITTHKDARKLTNRKKTDEVLRFILESYFNENK